ncbi:hypothetical protein IW140_004068 [Coemansia sp. RSA 1813]|nr:hypothetical protein EV178_003050 [Coemansia sp. RSA 1646]KAJ1766756.1 hypothetical protein LPJ74_005728 [Coemansia sp. RSA 1843]KAJ2089395.1 hypothetical protein IW138_003425 [Coemansia sp. RSA 986]KAJ2210564.1 hypothetical protein EV179_006144 [Coemansia sp. RSA 487]KAJ2568250.1 hypothetical protein IW140_004068 [Coemansia sp. RSA 1813]
MSAFWALQAKRRALPGLCVHSFQRSAARRFACLSVHVNYGNQSMSMEKLKRAFEKVGKVWDVIPVEANTSGQILAQALVRFYDGDYKLGASPGDPPQSLPPPTSKEVEAVTEYVRAAVKQFNKSILNGVEIYVCQSYDHSPTQLHRWYEDVWMASAEQNNSTVAQNTDIFPINPFYKQSEPTDDYQKGFREGFRLGMKDGYKDVS